MGKKAKSSRKGKKEWRANISTQDFDDYFEKTTKDALSGGSLADASNESLFFVDKSRDLSVKRKIDKAREKVLKVDSMLQRNPFIQAVPTSTQKSKKTLKKKERGAEDNVKDGSASGLVDLWDDKDEIKRKSKKKSKSIIPAVEVEHPGCSFNPDPESHQDALACAVADEMQKIYQQELGPEPIPSTVIGEVIDEEEKFFLDADEGTDEDDDQNEDLNDGGDANVEKRSRKAEKITRTQLNKRARHKDRLKAAADSKKAGALSKEIDSLGAILKEIKKEDAEKERRRVRRTVAKQERLKARPPRLGKYKFDPAPMQVLLSEEKTGSLRQLKGCCTLVKDRFKSLEKRGMIIPTRKSSRK